MARRTRKEQHADPRWWQPVCWILEFARGRTSKLLFGSASRCREHPDIYIHERCRDYRPFPMASTTLGTQISPMLAAEYALGPARPAEKPKLLHKSFCANCRGWFPDREFRWESGERLGLQLVREDRMKVNPSVWCVR